MLEQTPDLLGSKDLAAGLAPEASQPEARQLEASHQNIKNNNVTRLINLVFYLKEHESGATAAQIRADVSGYSSTQKDDTFKRQFRRDREKLTSMGFCIESQKRDGQPMPVYVLNLTSTMQDSLALSPSDIHLLKVCAKNAFETPSFLWKEDLVSALCKIQNAADAQILDEEDAGYANDAGAKHADAQNDQTPKLEQIIKIIEAAKRNKNMLVFDYQDHNNQKLTRLVVPIKIFRYLGDLYLFAYDKARQDSRRFRFDRFLNEPTLAHADKKTLRNASEHFDDEAGIFPFQIGEQCVLGKVYFSKSALGKAKQLIGPAFSNAFGDGDIGGKVGRYVGRNFARGYVRDSLDNTPNLSQNIELSEAPSDKCETSSNLGTCTSYGDGIIWSVRVANVERLAQWVVENGPGIYAIEPSQTSDIIKRGLKKIIEDEGC